MTYYAATVRVLVDVENDTEACDDFSEAMRPLRRNFTPGSAIVDWKYLSSWQTSTGEGFKHASRFQVHGQSRYGRPEATGWRAPHRIFDTKTRTYMPQPHPDRADVQDAADRLNKHGLDAFRWTCAGADEGLDGMRARVIAAADQTGAEVWVLEFIDGSCLEVTLGQLREYDVGECVSVAQGPEGNGHDLPTCRACGHPGSDEHTECPACNVCDDTSQNTYTVVLTRDVTESCFATIEASSIEEAKQVAWRARHGRTFEVDDNPPRDTYISDAWKD